MAGMTSGFSPRRVVDGLLDEIDEERAKNLRRDYGQRRWLVSWSRGESTTWTARLSGPEHPDTIERGGRTRIEAIEKAAIQMRQLLEMSA